MGSSLEYSYHFTQVGVALPAQTQILIEVMEFRAPFVSGAVRGRHVGVGRQY